MSLGRFMSPSATAIWVMEEPQGKGEWREEARTLGAHGQACGLQTCQPLDAYNMTISNIL